jgi:hypothetical protein
MIRRRWRQALLATITLAGLIWTLAAGAQELESSVVFVPQAIPEPLTVGDPVTLLLAVRHPLDTEVLLPVWDRELGGVEVLSQTAPQTVNNDNVSATTSQEIVVAVFAPGEYQIAPLTITQRRPDGSVSELQTPAISLAVSSVLTDDLNLRDLKPQATLPEPPLWPWLVGGVWLAVLLTTVLAGSGWWIYQRWFKKPVGPIPPLTQLDPRPPEVIAQAELDWIERLNLPAQNRLKEHYSLVTNCMRRYIEGRYGLPALERTTDELRTGFKAARTPTQNTTRFLNLFFEGDLVKFARYRPQPDDVAALIPEARRIVDDTTPVPVPAASSEPSLEAPS